MHETCIRRVIGTHGDRRQSIVMATSLLHLKGTCAAPHWEVDFSLSQWHIEQRLLSIIFHPQARVFITVGHL